MDNKPVKVFQSNLFPYMYVVVFHRNNSYSIALKNIAKKNGTYKELGACYYYKQLEELVQLINQAKDWIWKDWQK